MTELPEWPRRGDRLFVRVGDGEDSCLRFADDAHHLYQAGYREAAEILLHRVIEDHHGLDVLLYPIVFLARQHVELALKDILATVRELRGDRGDYLLMVPKKRGIPVQSTVHME